MARSRLIPALLFGLVAVAAATPGSADHVYARDLIVVLPRDAIPAITEPTFRDDRGWLPDEARVVGVDLEGDARAYPIAILNWHEIVDDVVGGTPVAVTFCPLCGTGIAFDRKVGGEVLVFKVSGMLFKNDLLMYDTATESLWAQLLGDAILGEYHGTRLSVLSSATMAWSEWRSLHPDSRVLDRPRDANGTFLRDYDENPYADYDSSPGTWYPVGNHDPYRVLHPKEPVLGVFLGGEARAYPQSVMFERRVVNDVLGGVPILVVHARGAMKAWERGDATFSAADDGRVRDANGRHYDAMTGQGPDGSLREIPAVTAFWFAWYDFYPATSIYGFFGVGEASAASPWEDPLIAGALVGGIAASVALVVGLRLRGRPPRARR